VHDSGGIVFRL